MCIFSHQNDCSGNNESHHLLSTNSVLSTGLLPQIRCIVRFAQTAEMVFIIHFIGNIWLRDRRWVEKKEKKTQRKLSKNDWLYTLCQRCCDRNRDTKKWIKKLQIPALKEFIALRVTEGESWSGEHVKRQIMSIQVSTGMFIIKFLVCVRQASQVALVVKNSPPNSGDLRNVG